MTVGCAPELIGEFLDTADPAALDADCLSGISRPPFWKSATGPGAPRSDSQP